MTIDSEIPIGAGLGSGGALEVATAKFLDAIFGLGLSKEELAEYAYLAEREELDIPCGRLDQYGSAFGGLLVIQTRPPCAVKRLPSKGLIFTVVDSGIGHKTAQIHPIRQREIDNGLVELLEADPPPTLRAKLARRHHEVRWEDLKEEELGPFLRLINQKSAKRILFTVRMNKSTELAIRLLRGMQISAADVRGLSGQDMRQPLGQVGTEKRKCVLIGKLMNYQHTLLRDLYEVSLPEIEDLRAAMLSAGAYGVKISGAGMGGALIAISSSKKEAKGVLKAALDAGASKGWVSGVAQGVLVERVLS